MLSTTTDCFAVLKIRTYSTVLISVLASDCLNSQLMKNSPFIKVRRNITELPEMTDLLSEEGSTGFGTYMIILLYLTRCPNCIGSYCNNTLRRLSATAHKSANYIQHIINNYDLFVIDGKHFYSTQLCATLNIDFTVNSESKEDALKLNSKSIKNDSKLNHESIQNQRNANMHNTYTHAQPREDIDIDKDNRYNDSETTATAVVKAAAPSVFLTKMNSIFDDENWLKTLEGQTGIKLFSDLTIRKQLISWFDKRLIMSACNEEQGYKPRDAKKYLRNLLLPGRKTQNEFNDLVRRGIERAKRKQLINPQEEQTSGPSEYETVVNGVRYARRKESVPMSAPPQVYVCRRWSCIRNAWVAPDSWDFEEEMIARRRLGMPDKLLIQ